MRSGGSGGAEDSEAGSGEADGRRDGEGAAARRGTPGGGANAAVGAATLPCARLTARQAIAAVADTYSEAAVPDGRGTAPGASSAPDGPLGWRGYDDARARARERTGEDESVVTALATIGGRETVVLSFEFRYLGGSLGERTGDRLEAAYTHAREHGLPVVSLIATGGSRMQEGMRALTQLQRVAQQSALNRAAGLPQLAVLRDPTTGGGWATLGAAADVILALPGAQVGFAGSRVRPPDADPAAYTAEGQLAAGHIDAVVPPDRLRATLQRWLQLLGTPREFDATTVEPAPPPAALGPPELPESGWGAVVRARASGRPRAEAYLGAYFDDREEISGDRCGGVDPGIRCGFGRRQGRTIAFAAQCGTATRPAGFRTAARLVRLADRLGIPVLTLVDTPGAANDAAAERAGAGAAIADTFAALATARVPVTSMLIGEGGSGGALALAAPDRLWATPDSYFSVIAPELAAAILKRDETQVHETADQLRIRPQDLLDLGVIRGIVPPA
ncbi:carboxyl transferase domain-containing protein [Streptomyces sp. P9-2B-2]|uniref:carboxyl transferase domain-containing protein n=1 Tax=Streptomyces sp. P9-2B-2 TaxID=3057114 RepID=UPI0025B5EB50|nr:carboxyl transferase domain-containing protein [Streptomyces sp. P9-2B-2]WJY36780.1 carboxyl transferase domain-containing protein [Streptomyces sp. P9-2B-2]